MRIIGGKNRGFIIKGPPDVKIKGLKPMPDKVRESIFNIIGKWAEGKKVLDLYVGTGAVGLEALSRGALDVTFVEISKPTINLITENLNKLKAHAKIIKDDVLSFIEKTNENYDLIFITPPHLEINFKVAEKAGEKLNLGGIIVLESDSKTEIPKIKGLKVFDQRFYGRLKITFLKID